MYQAIEGADIVLLESNHDPDMLNHNPSYPQYLKHRILSRKGHLSNDAGADAAVQLLKSGTKHLLLGHLSQENNTPEMAFEVTKAAIEKTGALLDEDVTLHVASRWQAGHLYCI